MPVGAYGGKREIMMKMAPAGDVYQAGTLSGNPTAMSAGLATLEALSRPGVYEELSEETAYLVSGLKSAAAAAGDHDHECPWIHGRQLLIIPCPIWRLR